MLSIEFWQTYDWLIICAIAASFAIFGSAWKYVSRRSVDRPKVVISPYTPTAQLPDKIRDDYGQSVGYLPETLNAAQGLAQRVAEYNGRRMLR